jgi:hypothetical protein
MSRDNKTAATIELLRAGLQESGIEPGTEAAREWIRERTGDATGFWSAKVAEVVAAGPAAEPEARGKEPEWRVPVTRTVALVVRAPNEKAARERALDVAWQWQPLEADGGDQGEVVAEEAALAGQGPAWCDRTWHDGDCCPGSGRQWAACMSEPQGADDDERDEEPPERDWDPGDEVDDMGGMSEVDPLGDRAAREEEAYFGQDYDAEPEAGR